MPKSLLLIGASRGLGYAMAQELSGNGWNVVDTVRGAARTRLHDLAAGLSQPDGSLVMVILSVTYW